ncbi:MAG: PEP/pyruvate-binding domain-containing protein, partial [Myxococcota bacterium]
MNSLLFPDSSPASLLLAGGKAAQLGRLSQLGFDVPPWFCLTDEALQQYLSLNDLSFVPPDDGDLEAFAREVEASFLAGSFPDALREAVVAAVEREPFAGRAVAVRSSGLDEDSSDHSFAGQYETFLYQRGADAVLQAIQRCWASAWSARVVSYRTMRGLGNDAVRMGVVVQLMVDADRAGVAFSRNPIDPLDRDHLIISSVLGLGEGLVSGALDADHFEVDRRTLELEGQTLVDKTEALRRNDEGGTQREPVPESERRVPSLSDVQRTMVAELCLRCEEHLGAPQDIEWAFEKDKLFLLQSRPITTLPPDAYFDPSVAGNEPTLWDNSNIVESYSGVTTPLTFSFASAAYRQVYIQFCEVMGVPQQEVEARSAMFRNMLGLIRGRVYYNLINWYRLLMMFPSVASNNAFMETMMGVKDSMHPELAGMFEFMKHPPRYPLPGRISVGVMTAYRFIRIDSIVREFQEHFDRVYDEARTRPRDEHGLVALAEHYQKLEDKLLRRWQAPIINDYYTMVFFGLLKQLTGDWLGEDETSTLHNDLLCGEGDLESTEPTKMLMRIARAIDQGPDDTRSWLLETPPARVWTELKSGMHPAIHDAFQEFLDRYGFRCVNELKLEEPDLHDDPSFAVQAVASYVRMKTYSIETMEKREHAIRQQAETRVRERLAGPKRWAYFWVLRRARKGVRHRENLRFARTKIFGIVRHIFRDMGERFVALGILREPHDIFYLTVDEIFGFIEGRPSSLAFLELVKARKQEFAAYRRGPALPDRFLTYGAVGAALPYAQVLNATDLLRGKHESDDPSVLKGIPCCPGVVEGTVRVVHDMKDAEGLDGEILVTERTDPGWVPLYPSCAALLIERGSLLSHSAVVARELGLPAVV